MGAERKRIRLLTGNARRSAMSSLQQPRSKALRQLEQKILGAVDPSALAHPNPTYGENGEYRYDWVGKLR